MGLPPTPPSQFQPWNGRDTVIYDVKAGKELDLGEGSGATFSPDRQWAGWIAGPESRDEYGLLDRVGEAWVMNLATGEKHDLGPGRAVRFDVAPRVAVFPTQRGAWKVFDYRTGDLMADQTTQGSLGYRLLADGNQLWLDSIPTGTSGANRPTSLHFSVRRPGDQSLLLSFDAMAAIPAGSGQLVVAMPPVDGNSNLFLLDLRSGKATPLASARPGNGPNWPFSATPNAVLWSDDFCSDQPGSIFLLDLGTRSLTQIQPPPGASEDERFVRLTPDGNLAQGSFGAKAVIDPSTLSYIAVLPSVPQNGLGAEPSWSADYRYASYSSPAGHGGLCGP